jgi:flagellar protein FlaJ
MSGQIGEVLAIASSDAKMSETLKKERAAEMFIYIAIVYLSFFVFMFVVAILATQFLPILAHITSKGLTGAGAFGGIGAIPAMSFDRLLFHACLIQAFFSGLIAGQMSESSVASGVKHACVLLVIALVVFKFILII